MTLPGVQAGGQVSTSIACANHPPNWKSPMISLDLTPIECEILADVLDNYLSDLRMEIAATDSMDFRDKLKNRKSVVEKVLSTLRRTQ